MRYVSLYFRIVWKYRWGLLRVTDTDIPGVYMHEVN